MQEIFQVSADFDRLTSKRERPRNLKTYYNLGDQVLHELLTRVQSF